MTDTDKTFVIEIPLDDLRVVINKRARLLMEDVVSEYWFKQRVVESIKKAALKETEKAVPQDVADKVTGLYYSDELLESVAGEIIAAELRAFFRTRAGKELLSKNAALVLQKRIKSA